MRLKHKQFKILLLSLVLVISSFAFLHTQASASTATYKVVNTNSLNVRKGPGINYKVIKKLKNNTTVTQTSKTGIWSKVKVGSTTGYVSSKYLKKVIKKVSNTKSNIGKYYSTTAASLNVRQTSSASSKKLGVLKFGTQLIIKGQAANGWYKVEYKTGKTGYVSNGYGIVSKSKDNVYPKGTIFGPLSGRTFVVDPGHGGKEKGASYYGIHEKDINLKASKILQNELIKNGAKVVMTRTTDKTLTLQKRVSISKATKPDAYLSIHHNVYVRKSEEGYLALYTKKSEKTFTQYVFKGLHKPISEVSDVPAEEYRYQNLHVLRENPYIGTLLEYGYMNRKSELEKIDTDEYRQAMAEGITQGMINYFNKY